MAAKATTNIERLRSKEVFKPASSLVLTGTTVQASNAALYVELAVETGPKPARIRMSSTGSMERQTGNIPTPVAGFNPPFGLVESSI